MKMLELATPDVELVQRIYNSDFDGLTEYERRLFIGTLAVGSMKPRIVAPRLGISPKTYKNHLASAYRKTNTGTGVQLLDYGLTVVTDTSYLPGNVNRDLRVLAGPAKEPIVPLGKRELQVAGLIGKYGTREDVACEQLVAPSTVKNQLGSIYQKLGLVNGTPGNFADMPMAYLALRRLDILPEGVEVIPEPSREYEDEFLAAII